MKVAIIFVSIIAFVILLFIISNQRDTFVSILSGGAVDIDVQQDATVILSELAKDPNRYKDFFGRYNMNSSRANQKYPLIWPLTAGNINSRLAFDPKFEGSAGNIYKKIIVTESPPTGEMLWFTGPGGAPNAPDSQLRAYDPKTPTDTNNFFGGWAAGVGGGNENAPWFGSSCPH